MDAAEVIAGLERRLGDDGYGVGHETIAGHAALVGRRSDFRWRWLGTRLHTFVVAFATPGLRGDLAAWLAAAAHQYSIDAKGGLPRGLQTGTAAVPVLVADSADPAARAWAAAVPAHRFGALVFPVLVESDFGTVTCFRERMRIGGIYAGHLRGVVRDIVEPVAS